MTDAPTLNHEPPRILTRSDGATIAYRQIDGKLPGVVFLGGFMSDMEGSKALALENHCREIGRGFLRFDYTGHGQSSGNFADGTIGAWADDAIDAIGRLTDGPQVLVGSSMGGWIMLLVALRLKERVAGLLGIAAAPDFTEDLIDRELTDDQRATMARDGFVEVACDYSDDPYTITQALIDDGREHLLLGRPIDFDGPVRLIQGIKDMDVPWRTALRIQEMLTGDDVEVTLVKDGDHRLSDAPDLARLMRTLDGLLGILG
ncbi:MAG: alpha/beta fold hydrolase [Alphaproteobacteria bacterium]